MSLISSILEDIRGELAVLQDGGSAGTRLGFVEVCAGDPVEHVQARDRGAPGLLIRCPQWENQVQDAARQAVRRSLSVLLIYVDASEWGRTERATGFGDWLTGAWALDDEILSRLQGAQVTVSGTHGDKVLYVDVDGGREEYLNEAFGVWIWSLRVHTPVVR